jgi:hypothetical protein
MSWIAITFATGLVSLILVVLAKRRRAVQKVDSVSDRWIADHHVESPP